MLVGSVPEWGGKTMRYSRVLFKIAAPALLAFSALSAFPQSSAGAAVQAQSNPADPERQQALELYRQHKMPEAAELLEKVVAKYPEDVVAHEALGTALLSRSDTQTDPEKRKADRLKARAELLRAKELGDNTDLRKVLLAGISEDGSVTKFSADKEVEAAMERGESAFAKGDWDNAIKEYLHALELDPKLYLAAVDLGDTYYASKTWDKAGEWFDRAVKIDPDQEIAYRYWADALMASGKIKEARAKFIEGVVAFPYANTSWNGLNRWLAQTHLAYNKIPIQLPQGPTTNEKGDTVISIDPSTLNKKDGGEAWMMYPMERSFWKNEKFAKEFPAEKTYRHTLKEEVDALSVVVTVFNENQKRKKIKNPDPSLVMLAQLQSEGMLEPYVLLVKADNEIAQDYSAYRAAHRDKLIGFVDKYVVPPAP